MSLLARSVLMVVGTLAPLATTLAAEEFEQRQVVFRGAGDTSLSGTLLVPKGAPRSRFGAVVLLSGSGPTDRDGNQAPALVTDLLKQIAEGLAGHGVASLRFDKRGMHANAKERPQDPAQLAGFFAWENFVADAVAAYKFLRTQPEVQGGRVGFLGHSEGGVLALLAADELTAEGASPAALVLLSTPGRSLDAIIDEQLTRLLKIQGASDEQSRYFVDENARIVQSIRETGKVPDKVPMGLKALYPAYLGGFLQSTFATDPCRFAARYAGPVLVVSGAKDVQVSPERDAAALDAALKSRKPDDHRLVIVPDASHNLKAVKTENEPGFVGDIVPGIVEGMAGWLTARLKDPAKAQPTEPAKK
jgi:uncharacterized protein